jgi:hypothetical protein
MKKSGFTQVQMVAIVREANRSLVAEFAKLKKLVAERGPADPRAAYR